MSIELAEHKNWVTVRGGNVEVIGWRIPTNGSPRVPILPISGACEDIMEKRKGVDPFTGEEIEWEEVVERKDCGSKDCPTSENYAWQDPYEW